MLYLRKASNDLVSHCRCAPEKTLIALPDQADCPWCGCGYLFSCIACRKAFTFAEPVETAFTLKELAHMDATNYYDSDSPGAAFLRRTQMFTEVTPKVLGDLVLGKRYVYLDGFAHVPEGEVSFRGSHGAHLREKWPQLEARNTEEIMAILGRQYWRRAEQRASMS